MFVALSAIISYHTETVGNWRKYFLYQCSVYAITVGHSFSGVINILHFCNDALPVLL